MPYAMRFFSALSTRSAWFNLRSIHTGVLVNKAEVWPVSIQILPLFFLGNLFFPSASYRHYVIFAINSIVT